MSDKPSNKPRPYSPVPRDLEADGTFAWQSFTSPTEFMVAAECRVPAGHVLPIIFVPGIMGTGLRAIAKNALKEGQPAWAPPNNDDENKQAGKEWIMRGAGTRQGILNPKTTEVNDSGPISVSSSCYDLLADGKETTEQKARRRGWGALHVASYASILSFLEEHCNTMFHSKGCAAKPQMNPQWKVLIDTQVKSFALKSYAPLSEDEVRRAADFAYPVHAVGYNWLQSNITSAQRLQKEIDRIIQYYVQTQKRTCQQVIVVTHSMGGLVARACAQLPGMNAKIVGVVHGVMPALGAAATYKRMRTGFEGLTQVVLGRNAAQATCVLANAPGPLELLPNRQYGNGWLEVRNTQGTLLKALPEQGNPYDDIYRDAKNWWRLIDPELIDPANKAKELNTTPWKMYEKTLLAAEDFHAQLGNFYHPNTYAFYEASDKRKAWGKAVWRAQGTVREDKAIINATIKNDSGNGYLMLEHPNNPQSFFSNFDAQDTPGDGTVPKASGMAPHAFGEGNVKQVFEFRDTDFDHQFAYDEPHARSAALYAIAKIAQSAKK